MTISKGGLSLHAVLYLSLKRTNELMPQVGMIMIPLILYNTTYLKFRIMPKKRKIAFLRDLHFGRAVLVAKTARPIAYNAMPVNSGTMHSVKICLWLKKMQMWMNAGFTGKTLSNATLCLRNQICL